ncbi:MAG TPA: M23 family metallopeptidase [Caldimonas sp.]|nr:M23 family metallopeptidase [Caldimonas sp.]
MAFVMFATGATSTSRVRSLPLAPLMMVSLGLATTLFVTGACIGYWLARSEPASVAGVSTASAVAPVRPEPVQPFTLEQLGAISARLFRLESEAAQLGARLGVPPVRGVAPPARGASGSQVSAESPRDATGGPWLAPRTEPADVGALESELARAEDRLTLLAAAASERTLQLMRLPTRLPVLGAEVASGFGNRFDPFTHTRAFHAGLDFAALAGTPISSAAGGTVSFAGFRPDYGWVVEIDHGNGLTTRYAHGSKVLVKKGDVVEPGQRIALVGSTGRSTGPHLHFEVLRGGDPVDPKRFLAGL